MEKISVIMPIYNCEKYLKRSIESVLNQTYKKLELILINDGSTDNSLKVCREYERKDDRVQVIDKKNGGVSSSRNAGLKIATGEYVTFVDADDWIYPSFLNDFSVNFFRDADLYIQGYVDSNGNEFVCANRYWYSDNLIVELDDIYLGQLYGFVWNKLFKSSILKDHALWFSEKITMIEDLLFIYNYLLYSKSVFNISQINYYYWRHESSACFRKHDFESWNLFIDNFYSLFSKYIISHKEFANRKLKVCYGLSLDILRSLYIDKKPYKLRIDFLKKIKKMAKCNDSVQVCTMNTLNNKLITLVIMYLPITFSDRLLCLANKLYSLRK